MLLFLRVFLSTTNLTSVQRIYGAVYSGTLNSIDKYFLNKEIIYEFSSSPANTFFVVVINHRDDEKKDQK